MAEQWYPWGARGNETTGKGTGGPEGDIPDEDAEDPCSCCGGYIPWMNRTPPNEPVSCAALPSYSGAGSLIGAACVIPRIAPYSTILRVEVQFFIGQTTTVDKTNVHPYLYIPNRVSNGGDPETDSGPLYEDDALIEIPHDGVTPTEDTVSDSRFRKIRRYHEINLADYPDINEGDTIEVIWGSLHTVELFGPVAVEMAGVSQNSTRNHGVNQNWYIRAPFKVPALATGMDWFSFNLFDWNPTVQHAAGFSRTLTVTDPSGSGTTYLHREIFNDAKFDDSLIGGDLNFVGQPPGLTINATTGAMYASGVHTCSWFPINATSNYDIDLYTNIKVSRKLNLDDTEQGSIEIFLGLDQQ